MNGQSITCKITRSDMMKNVNTNLVISNKIKCPTCSDNEFPINWSDWLLNKSAIYIPMKIQSKNAKKPIERPSDNNRSKYLFLFTYLYVSKKYIIDHNNKMQWMIDIK